MAVENLISEASVMAEMEVVEMEDLALTIKGLRVRQIQVVVVVVETAMLRVEMVVLVYL